MVLRAPILSTLLASLLVACAPAPRKKPSTEHAENNALVGVPVASTLQPGKSEPIRSPAGQWILPGTVDELGYVLPLDIRRPRPTVASRPQPSRAETLSRRSAGRGAPFPEHRLGPDDGHTQNETSIDIGGSTLIAGWNNYTDTTLVMGAGRSTDGGDTWSYELFSGHDLMSDPAVKAGGGGRWYFAYIAAGGATGSDVDVFVRRSIDDGATWQAPVVVTQNTVFDDKPYLDARGDEVLVAWADFGFSPAKVRVARSIDGGLSFANNTVLANNSVGGNGALPLIDADGTYYVFWRDSFQNFLWMSRSVDQGASWSADAQVTPMSPLPSTLPGGFRIINLPTVASPALGHLVVLWNDQLFGDPDILAVRSTDGGHNWSAPVRVNDDAGTDAQFFPWITTDEAGVLHAVWYDRRENGSDIDVYIASSQDGGATWSPNQRVTAAPFTPVLPWDVSVDFIGDYNAVAAGGGKVYPFFQDAREGNQDVWVAILPDTGALFSDGFESGDTSSWDAVRP